MSTNTTTPEIGTRVEIVEAIGLGTAERPLVGTLDAVEPECAISGVPHPYRVAVEADGRTIRYAAREIRALDDAATRSVEPGDLVDVDLSAFPGRDPVVVVLRERFEADGLGAGDAVAVVPCDDFPGCVSSVDTDATPSGLHFPTSAVGIPAGTREALLFGAVEDPAEILGRLRVELRGEENLRRQAATLIGRRAEEAATLRGVVERWRSDVHAIGTRLAEEADRENWCSEYEERVRDLAGALEVGGDVFEASACRTREYLVSVPVVAYVTVPVQARDEDEARDLADDDWTSWVTGDEAQDVDTSSRSSWDVEEAC